jgi:hypothetical protein
MIRWIRLLKTLAIRGEKKIRHLAHSATTAHCWRSGLSDGRFYEAFLLAAVHD